MKTMSYTESRARYAEVLDRVTNDREEVVVTRSGHEPVVIVALDEYESLRETAHLMRSPAKPVGSSTPWNGSRPVTADRTTSSRPTDVLLVWDENARDDHLWWQTQDRRTLKRINALLRDIQRNGNEGIGKPEALRHDFAGYWSRRITDEHRLVYKLTDDEVRIAACRYHYR